MRLKSKVRRACAIPLLWLSFTVGKVGPRGRPAAGDCADGVRRGEAAADRTSYIQPGPRDCGSNDGSTMRHMNSTRGLLLAAALATAVAAGATGCNREESKNDNGKSA